MMRSLFAVIATSMGFACLAYAFWLSQWDGLSPRRPDLTTVAGVTTFGLAGGLCMLSAAVALSAPRELPSR